MIYRFENCEIHTARFSCGATAPDPIEPQVFQLLVYLIDNRQRVVTRARALRGHLERADRVRLRTQQPDQDGARCRG